MLMMEELIEIVKQTYPTLPALPGNFREKRALLEAVNVRLAEAGRADAGRGRFGDRSRGPLRERILPW